MSLPAESFYAERNPDFYRDVSSHVADTNCAYLREITHVWCIQHIAYGQVYINYLVSEWQLQTNPDVKKRVRF